MQTTPPTRACKSYGEMLPLVLELTRASIIGWSGVQTTLLMCSQSIPANPLQREKKKSGLLKIVIKRDLLRIVEI